MPPKGSKAPAAKTPVKKSARQAARKKATAATSSPPKSPANTHSPPVQKQVDDLKDRMGSLEGQVSSIGKDTTAILASIKGMNDSKDSSVPVVAPVLTNPVVHGNEPTQQADARPADAPRGGADQTAPGKVSSAMAPATETRPTPYKLPPNNNVLSASARQHDNIFELFQDNVQPGVAQPRDLPLSFDDANDPVLGQKVQVLLHSAQQLSALKGRPVHAHEYIKRGPNQIKTTLNALTELEYVYGLYRFTNDPRTPSAHKAPMIKHMFQVIEDGTQYRWEQVREWSEDLLARVADDRIKWSDVHLLSASSTVR